MNRRTGHTPMDFEYTNRTGPIDESSPFITAARNAQLGTARKRDHGALNSPSKPQTPSLRPPASQPYFFSQPWASSSAANTTSTPFSSKNNNRTANGNGNGNSKPLPAVPSHLKDPKFNTPRKLDLDFSSGGETPDTPAENADSEATPDSSLMGIRSRVALFTSGGARGNKSPTKNEGGSPVKERRRDSWLGGLSRALGSPGGGREVEVKSVVRGQGPFSHKAERKIMRRRAATGGKSRREYYSDDDDDDDDHNDGRTRRGSGNNDRKASTNNSNNNNNEPPQPPAAQTPLIAAIFSYIETHPALPHILSYYAQLLLNFFIVFAIIYAVYTFWTAIQSDVNLESDRAVAETLAEMAVCAQNYRENKCERDTRMPALEVVCENWEKCMSRDPKKVGRARVSAHTFALIFNSFIEPISYKAMLFSLIIIFGCIAISNLAFGFFRNKHAQSHPLPSLSHQHQQQHFLSPPPGTVPPTPARFPGPAGYDAGFWAQTPGWGGQGQERERGAWQGGQGGQDTGTGTGTGTGSPVKQMQIGW